MTTTALLQEWREVVVVEEGVAKRETRTATGCEEEEQKNPKSTWTLFTLVLQRKAQGKNESTAAVTNRLLAAMPSRWCWATSCFQNCLLVFWCNWFHGGNSWVKRCVTTCSCFCKGKWAMNCYRHTEAQTIRLCWQMRAIMQTLWKKNNPDCQDLMSSMIDRSAHKVYLKYSWNVQKFIVTVLDLSFDFWFFYSYHYSVVILN